MLQNNTNTKRQIEQIKGSIKVDLLIWGIRWCEFGYVANCHSIQYLEEGKDYKIGAYLLAQQNVDI